MRKKVIVKFIKFGFVIWIIVQVQTLSLADNHHVPLTEKSYIEMAEKVIPAVVMIREGL